MPKRRRGQIDDPRVFYRRIGSQTVYVRDGSGRYRCFSFANGRPRRLPGGITQLAPLYGRVDFRNGRRFTGRTRSQRSLRTAFTNTPGGHRLTTGWVPLPTVRVQSRRKTNQGMNTATTNLTGNARSATNYAIWVDGTTPGSPVDSTKRYEWCHLLAHSMGGADDETNIVAAVKGNNTEQLAIESALQMYRCENAFSMRVTAACLDGGNGQHMGNVIRYEASFVNGGPDYVRYLDCLRAPKPSSIHFHGVLYEVVQWANRKLVQRSTQILNNAVSARDQAAIKRLG